MQNHISSSNALQKFTIKGYLIVELIYYEGYCAFNVSDLTFLDFCENARDPLGVRISQILQISTKMSQEFNKFVTFKL